ncbi:hypothetical protein MFIFM68171_00980 [Madurella fahalii]|uniref:Uncharacterized protein n=1 Tax=Madurella fahalii TaxID=1157608 RepID=A0ABQ0FZK3_9PEZI
MADILLSCYGVRIEIGFRSWTDVRRWLEKIVGPAYEELIQDFILPSEGKRERSEGSDRIKAKIVSKAKVLEDKVQVPHEGTRRGRSLGRHYIHFIIDAVARDRMYAMTNGHDSFRSFIATKDWALEPEILFGKMYELTDTICHDYWQPPDAELWDSNDSDETRFDSSEPLSDSDSDNIEDDSEPLSDSDGDNIGDDSDDDNDDDDDVNGGGGGNMMEPFRDEYMQTSPRPAN